jgi:hypothetical protein
MRKLALERLRGSPDDDVESAGTTEAALDRRRLSLSSVGAAIGNLFRGRRELRPCPTLADGPAPVAIPVPRLAKLKGLGTGEAREISVDRNATGRGGLRFAPLARPSQRQEQARWPRAHNKTLGQAGGPDWTG